MFPSAGQYCKYILGNSVPLHVQGHFHKLQAPPCIAFLLMQARRVTTAGVGGTKRHNTYIPDAMPGFVRDSKSYPRQKIDLNDEERKKKNPHETRIKSNQDILATVV